MSEPKNNFPYERIPSAPPPLEDSLTVLLPSTFPYDSSVGSTTKNDVEAARTFRNFFVMAILFSTNHGCTVACLALATARLGSLGAWQSGMLYLTYTASAIMGATYVVKTLGARNAIMAGMGLYCVYVACFLVATLLASSQQRHKEVVALIGAAVGGVGGGFLWTAQGVYFGQAAEEHASFKGHSVTESTSYLAGVFAFIYLTLEVTLRFLSTALLSSTIGIVSWSTIFGVYTTVAMVSTMAMVGIRNYPPSNDNATQPDTSTSLWYKVTAAGYLLRNDPKMKYMIGLNAVFGLTGAFLNSYVNGEVVQIVLHDENSKYVGGLSALVAVVAAIMSLVLAQVSHRVGKGPVLILGALCFAGVVLPFLIEPNVSSSHGYWGWGTLILIYALQGTGRATFESTLKATFADYFSYEKEGAFANIILQNGLSSVVGYILTFRLPCAESNTSNYCVEYRDGTRHNVLTFELLVLGTAVLAIVGYWRASVLYQQEQEARVVLVEEEEEISEHETAVGA